eukprot:8353334-Ditylum_brightwellii.AAC.1
MTVWPAFICLAILWQTNFVSVCMDGWQPYAIALLMLGRVQVGMVRMGTPCVARGKLAALLPAPVGRCVVARSGIALVALGGGGGLLALAVQFVEEVAEGGKDGFLLCHGRVEEGVPLHVNVVEDEQGELWVVPGVLGVEQMVMSHCMAYWSDPVSNARRTVKCCHCTMHCAQVVGVVDLKAEKACCTLLISAVAVPVRSASHLQ